MKIAVFFPSSLFCSWGMSYGLVDALERLGHEVASFPIDPSLYGPNIYEGPQGRFFGDDFSKFEGVIISGPEHISRYAAGNWADRPTVAWLHETVEREDYGMLDVESIKRSADAVFCPAIQDEKYGFKWLPLGVDTEIFKPDPTQEKTIDAGFIGLLYPKRQEFLKQLKPHLNGLKLHVGNVKVSDPDGKWNPRKTAEAYANAIRKMKVFVNLPSLSQMAVSKVYEVLACGVRLLTPTIEHMDNFEDLPCEFYSGAASLSEKVPGIGLRDPRDMAALTRKNHRLELRCEVLVNTLKQIGAKAA